MNKILNAQNKGFDNQLSYYLELRKNSSNSKASAVKRILRDVRKNKDLFFLNFSVY